MLVDYSPQPSLGSDNHSGVHPDIMAALSAANLGHVGAYGVDAISAQAETLFREHFGDVRVAFVFNGTAANVLGLRALMPAHAAVLCADTAHLHVDECAAPEFHVGCKVLAVPAHQGKITPHAIVTQMIRRGDQHYAAPRVVSITQPTEVGTLYSCDELRAIASACQEHGLRLHIDGARLVNAAAALGVSLHEACAGADVLSFGGTKNGLMFGEAVVFFKPELFGEFASMRKQSMQLGSKMRFVAAQFVALLHDSLWLRNARHANAMAQLLAQQAGAVPGVQICQPVQANAVFASFPRPWYQTLRRQSFFYVWSETPFQVRWMTTFDTTREQIEAFVAVLRRLAAG